MGKFYIGTGKKLSDNDFVRIAKSSGISVAKLKTVNQVEARNRGSYSSGALVCLYEPHIAYKKTGGTIQHKLMQAGLAYRRWGATKYPKFSFKRIDACTEIAGEEIAAWSTSWGLGQIMGFNHKAVGFDSAIKMVKWFAISEANQLEGMVRFISSNPQMKQALTDGEWAAFARLYNGSGYKKNKYDTKLAAAYKKWKNQVTPEAPPKQPAPMPPIKREAPKTVKPILKPSKRQKVGAKGIAGIVATLGVLVYAFLKSWGLV